MSRLRTGCFLIRPTPPHPPSLLCLYPSPPTRPFQKFRKPPGPDPGSSFHTHSHTYSAHTFLIHTHTLTPYVQSHTERILCGMGHIHTYKNIFSLFRLFYKINEIFFN